MCEERGQVRQWSCLDQEGEFALIVGILYRWTEGRVGDLDPVAVVVCGWLEEVRGAKYFSLVCSFGRSAGKGGRGNSGLDLQVIKYKR